MKSINLEEFMKMLEEDKGNDGEAFIKKVLDKAKDKELTLEVELFKRLDKLSPKCKEQKINVFLELIYLPLENDKCLECGLRKGVRKLDW